MKEDNFTSVKFMRKEEKEANLFVREVIKKRFS